MAEYKGKLIPLAKNSGGYEVNYSTTEHEIGTWIDGSVVYEKTINCGALPSAAGNKAIAHNISNLDKVISLDGIALRSTGQFITLPTTAVDSLLNQIVLYGDRTNINIYVGSNQSIYVESYATIRYTKTA